MKRGFGYGAVFVTSAWLLTGWPALLGQSATSADAKAAETFLTPTTTAEMSASDQGYAEVVQQQVATHQAERRGDLRDARRIQLLLARYWVAHNQSAHAGICLQRAEAAGRSLHAAGGIGQTASASATPPGYGVPGQGYASGGAGPAGADPNVGAYPSPMLPPAMSGPQVAGIPGAQPPNCGKGKSSRFFYKLAAALDTAAQQMNPNAPPSNDPCVIAHERPGGTVSPPMGGPPGAYGNPVPGGMAGGYPVPPPGGSGMDGSGYALPPAGSIMPGPVGLSSPSVGAPGAIGLPGPAAPASPPAPAPLPGQTLGANRGYWAMLGQRLDKWDFNHDGTFLHTGVVAAVGTGVRNSERGVYRIQGNRIVLQVGNTATAFVTPGSGSGSSLVGGGTGAAAPARTLSIQLIGPDGAGGIVLNGTTYKIRHGW